MKAGLMEIADIFVVNKSDRPGADAFVRNLKMMLAPAFSNHRQEIPILKTIADKAEGITELAAAIETILKQQNLNDKKYWLLTEKAYHLIQQQKMKGVNKLELKENIMKAGEGFNLYRFIKNY